MYTRVKRVHKEGNYLIIEYNDCSTEQIDLCDVQCDGQPSDDPGKYPDPIDDPATRCRIATHLGELAANRLNNYLDGLILSSSVANFIEAYVPVKLAEYGWSIALYDELRSFTYDLFTGGGAGIGLDAKNEWTANSAAVITQVQEALYCSLDDLPPFTATERQIWATVQLPLRGDFPLLLGTFLRIWPYEQLRQLAFEASINTDAVSCESFDCEGSEPVGCEPGELTTTLISPEVELWDTPLRGYSSPPRPARDFYAGETSITLPSPLCITQVRFSWAGQSGRTWGKVQISLDGVLREVQADRQHTSCNTNNDVSNVWIISPPVEASVITLYGLEPGGLNNPAAPAVIHCAHITHGI